MGKTLKDVLFGNPDQHPWMQLNPDYRRDAPKKGIYCCRCQKALLKPISARVVEVNYETLEVRNNPMGRELIGTDCWERVLEENKPSRL